MKYWSGLEASGISPPEDGKSGFSETEADRGSSGVVVSSEGVLLAGLSDRSGLFSFLFPRLLLAFFLSSFRFLLISFLRFSVSCSRCLYSFLEFRPLDL